MKIKILNFIKEFQKIINNNKNNYVLISNKEDSQLKLNYYQFSVLIFKACKFLKKKKIKETVIIFLPNCPEAIVIIFGLFFINKNVLLLNYNLSDYEVNQYINSLNFKNLIIVTNKDKKITLDKIKIKKVFLETDEKFEFLNKFSSKSVKKSKSKSKLIILTSGTTGKPKTIEHDINKLWSSGYYFLKFHKLESAKLCFWNFLPISYLGGIYNLCLIPIISSGSFVLDQEFNGNTFFNFWQTVKRHNINAIWFVPTIIKGLYAIRSKIIINDINISNQKILCFLGTAPINYNLKKKFESFFNLKLLENYALSETTFISSENYENIKYRSKNSKGEILPYVKINFINNKIKKLKNIYVNTPFLCENAHNDNLISKNNLVFFNTRDLGNISNKKLIVNGRDRDIIKKGGHLIFLQDIEELIENIDLINRVAAKPTFDKFYGENYNLFISLSKRASEAEKNTIELKIRDMLSKYKWPKKIIFRSTLKTTSSGKIKK
jgi:acyl-CoA synthetase (AMP-forming)/AMP-acid ligase II